MDYILEKKINKLNLSVRTSNRLMSAGIETIKDLVTQRESDLLEIKNFGQACLNEIKSLLKNFGLQLNMNLNETQNKKESFDDFQRFFLNKEIRELKLSIRSLHCLDEKGIKTVKELVSKSEEELLSIKNFGIKCLKEIKASLEKKGLNLNMKINGDLEKVKDNKQQVLPLFSHSSINIKISEIKMINLNNVSVNALSLNTRAKSILQNKKIKNLAELVNTPFKKFLFSKNCGLKTANEIRWEAAICIISLIDGKNIDCPSLYDWLIYVRNEILENNCLERIFKNHKYKEIFKRRFGIGQKIETLQAIGNDFSLTRERIRQISKHGIQTFLKSLKYPYREFIKNFISEFYKYKRLLCYEGSDFIIKTDEFSLFNSILSFKNKKIVFDHKAKIWRDKNFPLLKKIDSFLNKQCDIGKNYTKSEIRRFAEIFIEKHDKSKKPTKLSPEAIERIIVSYFFKKHKEIYFFKRINLINNCAQLIRDHFPNGIAIYKDINKFLSLAKREGYKELLNKNKRALVSFILRSDELVLWNWGEYIHLSNIKISDTLLKKVALWISERFNIGIPKVSMWGAYNMFKEECKNSGIPNEHALYSCMKMKYDKKFSFLKDPYVYPHQIRHRIKKKKVIEDFLLQLEKEATYKEIEQKLGLKDYQINQIIEDSNKIIYLGNGKYIHRDNIKIDKEDFHYLEKCIERELGKFDHISIEQIYKNNIVICMKNKINNPYVLYSVFSHFRKGNFYFPRFPHIISQKRKIEDDGNLSFNDIVNHFFLAKKGVVYHKELYEYFVSDRGYKEKVIVNMPYLCENILRYTKSSYVSLETINWSEEKDLDLEKTASARFQKDCSLGRPFSLIYDLFEEKLPVINENIKISWQKTLLRELLERLENIKIIGSLRETYIVVPNKKKIYSEEDLIYYVLLNDFNGATHIDRLKSRLNEYRISKSLGKKKLHKKIKISKGEVFINN